MQSNDPTIVRTFNPLCSACAAQRIHTERDYRTFHRDAGTGFSREHGVPPPVKDNEARFKLIDIQSASFSDLAVWAYRAQDYIRDLEKKAGILR